MNYKEEIEKMAGQPMPHLKPDGGHALPFGYSNSRYDSVAAMNDALRKESETEGYLWDEVPDNLTPFASKVNNTLLHDGNGRVYSYTEGENRLSPQLAQTELDQLYTAKDVLSAEDKDMISRNNLTKTTLENLYGQGDAISQGMGFKDEWDAYLLWERMNKAEANDRATSDFMSQYKQASEYKQEIEKMAREHVYKLDKGPFKNVVEPYVSEDAKALNSILDFLSDRYPKMKDKLNIMVSDPSREEDQEGYFDPEGVCIDFRDENLTQEEFDNLKECMKDDIYGSRLENGMHNVISPDDKYTLLHEIGHGVDHDKRGLDTKHLKSKKLSNLLMTATPIVSTIGGYMHPLAGLGATALGTAGVAALAHHYNKGNISGEFGANEFVREYLAHELGSEEDAMRAYRESTLPEALNSYRQFNRNNLKNSTLSTLALGLTGLAYGATSLKA